MIVHLFLQFSRYAWRRIRPGARRIFFTLAAVDTANPYGAMGASRTRLVGFLAEPVFMIVFFTVSFVAGSTIPYIVQQAWVQPLSNFFEPAHVLVMLAFFILILAEGGRIPVDNPSGHFELAMIDESKGLEFSGPAAALMKWGGEMKLFVLICIFLNVLVTPWGLAASTAFSNVLLAIPLVLLKISIFVLVLVADNNVDFQEFMIALVGLPSLADALRGASETFIMTRTPIRMRLMAQGGKLRGIRVGQGAKIRTR